MILMDIGLNVYSRINRNILECKYIIKKNIAKINPVLIETYWNVNYRESSHNRKISASINRNILECKYLCVVRRTYVVGWY